MPTSDVDFLNMLESKYFIVFNQKEKARYFAGKVKTHPGATKLNSYASNFNGEVWGCVTKLMKFKGVK